MKSIRRRLDEIEDELMFLNRNLVDIIRRRKAEEEVISGFEFNLDSCCSYCPEFEPKLITIKDSEGLRAKNKICCKKLELCQRLIRIQQDRKEKE